MALSPNEELELLQLEEEEYQQSVKASPAKMSSQQIDESDRLIEAEQGAREIDAGLSGLAQGATFGLSDELGATKDVVVDAFTGNKLGKSWRELQKAREAANKQLAEESPLAYGAGELTGGVASSLLIPTAGAARIAGTAAKVSPKLASFLAGQGGSAVSRIAGKGATMAIQGAPVGLAYGVGASENDISQPTELAKDAASGLAMGSLTGLAIGAGVQGGKESFKKAANILEDSNYARAVKEGFNFGDEQGVNLGSGKAQEKLTTLSDEYSESFVDKIMKTDRQIGEKVGAAIDNAQASGVKINVDPKIQSTVQKLFNTMFVQNPTLGEFVDPKTAKLLKVIGARQQGDMTPIEARALKDELYKLSDNLSGINSESSSLAKNLGSELASEVNNALKTSIPDYQLAAREFEEFRRLVPETILSKGTPSRYGKVYMGDLKNPELKLFQETSNVIEGSQLPGDSKTVERKTFEMLKRNLKDLQSSNPQATQTLGGSADDILGNLRKQSDKVSAVKIAQGVDPQAGVQEAVKSSLGMLSTTGKGIGVSVANKVGLGTKAVRESSPVKMGKAVFDATDQGLYTLSGKLKANQATAILGDSLENALNNKNEAGKNAVLFKLMQNPEYRNILREEGVSEEE